MNVENSILPDSVLAELQEGDKPSSILNGKSGFSAAGPILFQLASTPDPLSLPIDGGDAVKVFDLNTGEELSVFVNLSNPASHADETNPRVVVEVSPMTRFPYGHKLLAVLTNKLKNLDGESFSVPSSVQEVVSDSGALANYYSDALDFLAGKDIQANEILSLTDFTVQDRSELSDSFMSMVNLVTSQDHPVEILSVDYHRFGAFSAKIEGRIRLVSFRESDGRISYTPGGAGKDYWTNFSLWLPSEARQGPVPVVIYGHGLNSSRQSAERVGESALKEGHAVFAIDQPQHGDRVVLDGGDFSSILTPGTVSRLTGMVVQSPLDMNSVLTGIRQHLDKLDVLPEGGDGVIELDTTRISYLGTSLGGLLGGAFVGSAGAELNAGYLQVPGVGVTHVLSNSSLYNSNGIYNVIPSSANGAESAWMIAVFQSKLDQGDSIHYVDWVRTPQYSAAVKPLAIMYGQRDKIVPFYTAERLARLADLPLVGLNSDPVTGLRVVSDMEHGYGVNQNDGGHLSFLKYFEVRKYRNWLKQLP
ncbi:MAG: hypothetical protein ACR2PX_20310 [Endozoicomonas sp.]|uniref:hypothetical protein n=1 Tax=Endozoicomonas sp. TaxID=1892382 RepID=UPI003D9B68FF